MLLITSYFTFAPLLLMLTSPAWKLSQSVPMMGKQPVTDSCVSYSWTLLQNIIGALMQNSLFNGIDCPKQSIVLNNNTLTESVCTPKESTCYGFTKSEFDQESCLTNIGEDLRHYSTFLEDQPDPEHLLGPTVLFSLKELMKHCFAWALPKQDVPMKEATADRPSSYDERLNLCKVLRGFQVRTITVNRAVRYINSGQHTK
ncbi:uncharacterized protein LOC117521930 [Thalassophryne amazonica]|uniref:uncharacterized protein LOC117521930 n=1 Tax=Thalassophryne amazonica TaxID=390379 RepID=UPI001471BC67|nr:uncharacterized protein LOC117521930 [Thalassophryne amazonica]